MDRKKFDALFSLDISRYLREAIGDDEECDLLDMPINFSSEEVFTEAPIRIPNFKMERVFQDKWKQLGFTDDDLIELEEYLSKSPMETSNSQNLIRYSGGFWKLRWERPGSAKGKSGAVRIIYYPAIHPDPDKNSTIFLYMCYQKDGPDEITREMKNTLKKVAEKYKKEVS